MAEEDLRHHFRLTIVVGGRSGPSQHRGQGGIVSETVDRPMPTTPARSYAMKAREDQNSPEVIAGIFSVTPQIPVRPDWRIRTEFGVRDSGLGIFT